MGVSRANFAQSFLYHVTMFRQARQRFPKNFCSYCKGRLNDNCSM